MNTPRWLTGPTSNGDIHVVPIADLIEHTAHDCVCGPDHELVETGPDVWLVVHLSLDGREVGEESSDRM